MTELSREQIERDRESIKAHLPPSLWMMVDRQCDMALAKKDAEERVAKLERALAEKEPPAGKYCYVADKRRKQAEAECERLRDALGKFYGLSNDLLCRKDPKGLLEACADAQKALVPTDGEPCDVCGGEGRRALPNATNTIIHHPFCTACKGTGKVPHTPEQSSTMDHGGVRHEPKQAHGDALADDLDGALDCLYTKAMRDRDINGPDAYAISQAYDLVCQALDLKTTTHEARIVTEEHPVGNDAVYVGKRCIARGNWFDMTTLRDQINRALKVADRHLTASCVPKGDYHEGFEEGVRAGHGVPEDNND